MNPVAIEPSVELPTPGSRVLLHGISWDGYQQIDSAIGERGAVRLLYLDGDLEIKSPVSRNHETPKERISLLLELFLLECGKEFLPSGNATILNEARGAGGEPDLSYCIGKEKPFPDLCVEVVVSSGGVDKLEFYRRFEIPEVWFWQGGKLTLYVLDGDRYAAPDTSRLLPRLNVELFSECVKIPSSLESARKFRAGI